MVHQNHQLWYQVFTPHISSMISRAIVTHDTIFKVSLFNEHATTFDNTDDMNWPNTIINVFYQTMSTHYSYNTHHMSLHIINDQRSKVADNPQQGSISFWLNTSPPLIRKALMDRCIETLEFLGTASDSP